MTGERKTFTAPAANVMLQTMNTAEWRRKNHESLLAQGYVQTGLDEYTLTISETQWSEVSFADLKGHDQ